MKSIEVDETTYLHVSNLTKLRTALALIEGVLPVRNLPLAVPSLNEIHEIRERLYAQVELLEAMISPETMREHHAEGRFLGIAVDEVEG